MIVSDLLLLFVQCGKIPTSLRAKSELLTFDAPLPLYEFSHVSTVIVPMKLDLSILEIRFVKQSLRFSCELLLTFQHNHSRLGEGGRVVDSSFTSASVTETSITRSGGCENLQSLREHDDPNLHGLASLRCCITGAAAFALA